MTPKQVPPRTPHRADHTSPPSPYTHYVGQVFSMNCRSYAMSRRPIGPRARAQRSISMPHTGFDDFPSYSGLLVLSASSARWVLPRRGWTKVVTRKSRPFPLLTPRTQRSRSLLQRSRSLLTLAMLTCDQHLDLRSASRDQHLACLLAISIL